MNPEVKAKWVEALRSGEYKQGKGALRKKTKRGDRYCCLGVLCEIAVKEGVIPPPKERHSRPYYAYDAAACEESFLPDEVIEWAGVGYDGFFGLSEDGEPQTVRHRGQMYVSLADLNDRGVKFNTIARIIEKEF